jgi:hypothetical protein
MARVLMLTDMVRAVRIENKEACNVTEAGTSPDEAQQAVSGLGLLQHTGHSNARWEMLASAISIDQTINLIIAFGMFAIWIRA